MQEVSALYRTLAEGAHRAEVRVLVAGTVYGKDAIYSGSITRSLWPETVSVGNCVAAQIDLQLRVPDPAAIPRMARLEPQFRLTDGTQSSEWLPLGVFYLDTRSYSPTAQRLTIHGYDAMLKAEAVFAQAGDQGEWPMKDADVVDEICQRLGVTLDPRTEELLWREYDVQFPGYGEGAYTMREVLGYIGAMYAGNWILTEEGKLRLLCLGDATAETFYLVDQYGRAITLGGDRILVG